VRVHFLALFLCVCAGAVAAEQNRPPRLIAMGCNFDGGLTWLALGKARAGSELDSFRVIPDVDLERVDATISPSNMDMFMPYGQGPVVGPINVSRISIGPRTVHNAAVKMLAYEIAQALVLLSRRVSCGSSTLPMVQWLNCRNPTCSRSSPRKRFSS